MTNHHHDMNMGLIGNGSIAALVGADGSISWSCVPGFDGPPVFCSLLSPTAGSSDARPFGHWTVTLKDCTSIIQAYRPHTAVLDTIMTNDAGDAVVISDFAPKTGGDPLDRPRILMRSVEVRSGNPIVTVECRPSAGYGYCELVSSIDDKAGCIHFSVPQAALNSARAAVDNHPEVSHEEGKADGSSDPRTDALSTADAVSVSAATSLTLWSNLAPASLLEQPLILSDLDGPLVMTFGEQSHASSKTVSAWLQDTIGWWKSSFVSALDLPGEWQEDVIRAAITVKLCQWEDTGALVAAVTTSISEAADTGRNWDYRFCWVRDSYFSVAALESLGIQDVTVGFSKFLRTVTQNMRDAGDPEGLLLQPLYTIAGNLKVTEWQAKEHMDGYRKMGPVRIGNAAYVQKQWDVYGEAVLSVMPMFFNPSFTGEPREELYAWVRELAELALAKYDVPDAGLWELRGFTHVHTFTSAMCWVAVDRVGRIARHLNKTQDAERYSKRAATMRERILTSSWNEEKNAIVDTWDGDMMDASLLLLPDMEFIDGKDPKFVGTVAAVEKELVKDNGGVLRYRREDDFGVQHNEFNICTCWYALALEAVGRKEEARKLFTEFLSRRNPLGIMSEDTDFASGELWGNMPQAYSMVGIIQAAKRLSQ